MEIGDALTTNNFVSVDYRNGKIYTATASGVYTIDVSNDTLFDYHTKAHRGSSNELLENKEIVDSTIN